MDGLHLTPPLDINVQIALSYSPPANYLGRVFSAQESTNQASLGAGQRVVEEVSAAESMREGEVVEEK